MGSTPAEQEPGTGEGYWFTPVPVYLLDAALDPKSPVNGPAVVLWSHLHRNYAWRHRVFPSHATLAKETGQSESAVRRQMLALRKAGAIDWGANYGPKGRSSNEYALAPRQPFEFDRPTAQPVTVKNERHPEVTVKNDGGVEVKNERHPTVKNERVVESTEELKTLSPRLPQQTAPELPAASDEREIEPLTQKLMAQHRATEDEVTTILAQVRREGWVKNLVSWALSPTGAVDVQQRLTEHRRAARARDAPPAPVRPLPPWCEDLDCDEDTRLRTWRDEQGFAYTGPCHCHPDNQKDTAA